MEAVRNYFLFIITCVGFGCFIGMFAAIVVRFPAPVFSWATGITFATGISLLAFGGVIGLWFYAQMMN